MSLTGEAKQLLNNETLTAAFDAVRTQAIGAALAAKPHEDEFRRRCLDAANTVDRVRSHLAAVIQAQQSADETAKMAQVEDFYRTQAQARWNAAAQATMGNAA